MTVDTVLYSIAAVASAAASVLAWIAKIRWAGEYRQAKEELLRTKDAQVAMLEREVALLRERDPVQLRNWYVDIKKQMEAVIDQLRSDLHAANEELERTNAEIAHLAQIGASKELEIAALREERERLERRVHRLASLVRGSEAVEQHVDTALIQDVIYKIKYHLHVHPALRDAGIQLRGTIANVNGIQVWGTGPGLSEMGIRVEVDRSHWWDPPTDDTIMKLVQEIANLLIADAERQVR